LALLYFERLKKCNLDYLERTIASDLFLVSLMVSAKFLFDDGEIDEVFMDEWAASSGMTCRQLVLLERDFLKAINWELYASEPSFWKKLGELEMQLAIKEGKTRGYFTYTELQILGDIIGKDLPHIVQCVVAISVILAATYAAGFLTILGSVALASTIPGTSLYQSRMSSSNVLPITDHVLTRDQAAYTPQPCNETKSTTPIKFDNLNAIKVFKASILLASIKPNAMANSSDISSTETNTFEDNCQLFQYVSWDWWNVPVMNWLSKASEYIETFEFPAVQNYIYFLENAVTNEKFIYLGDHIHKATKTRIQDQLEGSWHVEWADTIKHHLSYYNILPYLQNIKP